jgi:hypothetical protein
MSTLAGAANCRHSPAHIRGSNLLPASYSNSFVERHMAGWPPVPLKSIHEAQRSDRFIYLRPSVSEKRGACALASSRIPHTRSVNRAPRSWHARSSPHKMLRRGLGVATPAYGTLPLALAANDDLSVSTKFSSRITESQEKDRLTIGMTSSKYDLEPSVT